MSRKKAFSLFVILGLVLFILTIQPMDVLAVDFGGRTVTIFAWGGPPDHLFREGGDYAGRIEEAEEKFNMNLEFDFIEGGDYASGEGLITRLLAGDSTHDIWMQQQRWFWPIVHHGIFYPVSEVLSPEYYEALPALPRTAAKEGFTYRGETYGFGVEHGAIHPIVVTMYNKDLFEREGLPDLYDIYKAGDWTWDKLTEIGTQVIRDTTGDGEIDQWGIVGQIRSPTMAVILGSTNQANPTTIDKDGQVKFAFNEEPALETLHQLYNWMYVDGIVGSSQRIIPFSHGEAALEIGGFHIVDRVNAIMEEDFGVVPLPMGPRETEYRYHNTALISWVLPANAENPEGLVKVLDFMWRKEEYDERLQHYIEARVRDRRSANVMMQAHDNWAGEAFDLEYAIRDLFWGPISAAMTGEESPSAAMDMIAPVIQTRLDEIYGQ